MARKNKFRLLGAIVAVAGAAACALWLATWSFGGGELSHTAVYRAAVDLRWRHLPGASPSAAEWSVLANEVLMQYAEQYPEFANERVPLGVTAYGVWPDGIAVPVSEQFELVGGAAIEAKAMEYGRYRFVSIYLEEASLSRLYIRVSGHTEIDDPQVALVGRGYDLVLDCRPIARDWLCNESDDDV